MKKSGIQFIKILLWGLGSFFFLVAISFLHISTNVSLVAVALGTLLIPPTLPFIKEKLGINIKAGHQAIAAIVLFIALIAFTPSSPKTNSPNTAEPNKDLATETTGAVTPTLQAQPSEVAKLERYEVVNVVDGDTIDVMLNNVKTRVRLIGVDTPEIVDPRKPVQCFAKQASDKTKATLTGKMVGLEEDNSQGDKDKYGRILRYVFLEDGTNFNKMLISEGFAHEYTYDLPYKYQAEFKDAQKYAMDNKLGLWADNACAPEPTPTAVITPTPYATPVPTPYYTPRPTAVPTSQATPKPNNNVGTSGNYTCNCSKTCTQIKSCDEAYFQLNKCGCSKRDGDKDGIPCEELCN